ncbi:MAG: calcium-binding protein [Nocardioidaceae bacterium]
MVVSTVRGSRVVALGSVLLLGSFSVVFVGAGSSSATNGRCLGMTATIVGTDLPDVIVGTAGADVIMGLGAHDVIRGLGGNDRICGGRGLDELFGGEGRDRLAGQADPPPSTQLNFPSGDTLAGGKGDDVLYGGGRSGDSGFGDAVSFRGAVGGVSVDLRVGKSHGQGDDTLVGFEAIIGSAHADSLRAVRGAEVHAGKGNDRLHSAPGPETLLGGGGQDHLVLGPRDSGDAGDGADVLRMKAAGNATAEGGGGADTFVGGPGPDTFYDFSPSVNNDVAHGRGGSDVIELGIGSDVSVGGPGGDVILAGPGADRVDGGPGRDRYSGGTLSSDGFTVNLRLGTATGGGTGVDQLTSIADVDGSFYDDVLIGDANSNDFFAGPGDDQMSGGAADDVLTGFDGVDQADGGPGIDTCTAENLSRCEQ